MDVHLRVSTVKNEQNVKDATWDTEIDAALTDLRDNLDNLRLESHVEHAVSLIQYQVRNTLEIRHPCVQKVNESTRRRNQHFDTVGEISLLRPL